MVCYYNYYKNNNKNNNNCNKNKFTTPIRKCTVNSTSQMSLGYKCCCGNNTISSINCAPCQIYVQECSLGSREVNIITSINKNTRCCHNGATIHSQRCNGCPKTAKTSSINCDMKTCAKDGYYYGLYSLFQYTNLGKCCSAGATAKSGNKCNPYPCTINNNADVTISGDPLQDEFKYSTNGKCCIYGATTARRRCNTCKTHYTNTINYHGAHSITGTCHYGTASGKPCSTHDFGFKGVTLTQNIVNTHYYPMNKCNNIQQNSTAIQYTPVIGAPAPVAGPQMGAV